MAKKILSNKNIFYFFQRHINRTHPNIEDSIKILERIDNGEKIKNLANEYKISKWRIRLIKKSKEHFLKQKKLMKQGKIYEKDVRLEQALYTWFLQKRSIGKPVTEPMLKSKALEFNELYKGTKNFKGISGFMNEFKTRHNIKCLTNDEKALSMDQELNNNFYQEFIKYCTDKKIPLDKIYNADETGLNWKMMPKKILTSDKHQSSSEIKSVEDRVTLMVCTNATGSHKLPLLIIGKTNNPNYLKKTKSLPIVYMNQTNAWMDGQLMSRWYREVFLPEIERVHGSNNEKCLLLLDNASSHLSTERLNSIDERCRVIFLPPNVSSLVQPMNQGIVEKLKKMYKKKFLNVMLVARNVKKSIPKLLELFEIPKLACLISEVWGDVTENDVKNAWRNIFPFCSDPEPEFDSQSLLHMVAKIPKHNNITLEEINSWLHSDDTEQGWQVLNDQELAFPEEDDNIVII